MPAQIGLDSAKGVIAAGASVSDAINLGAGRVRGILMPSAWTTAVLTFLVSLDGVTFVELTDPRTNGYSSAAGMAAAANEYVVVDPALFDGVNVIKIRSGTSGAPVNQVAQADLTVALRLY